MDVTSNSAVEQEESLPEPKAPASRTPETEARYQRQFASLWEQFRSSAPEPHSALTFVNWFAEDRKEKAVTTARAYKWAVVHVLEVRGHDDLKADPTVPEALGTARGLANAGVRDSTKTSALKARVITSDDQVRLFAALAADGSLHAPFVNQYFTATPRTGHREIEWWGTESVQPEPGYALKLIIPNAKCTNGRGTGPSRTLRWRVIEPEVASAVEWLAEHARRFESREEFSGYTRRAQDALARIVQVEFRDREERLALSTARHVFADVMTNVYKDDPDRAVKIAALMGQVSTATAPGYGTWNGFGGIGDVGLGAPEPDPREIEVVRRILERTRARLDAMQKKRKSALRDQLRPDASIERDLETNLEVEPRPAKPEDEADMAAPALEAWLSSEFPKPDPKTETQKRLVAEEKARDGARLNEACLKRLDENLRALGLESRYGRNSDKAESDGEQNGDGFGPILKRP